MCDAAHTHFPPLPHTHTTPTLLLLPYSRIFTTTTFIASLPTILLGHAVAISRNNNRLGSITANHRPPSPVPWRCSCATRRLPLLCLAQSVFCLSCLTPRRACTAPSCPTTCGQTTAHALSQPTWYGHATDCYVPRHPAPARKHVATARHAHHAPQTRWPLARRACAGARRHFSRFYRSLPQRGAHLWVRQLQAAFSFSPDGTLNAGNWAYLQTGQPGGRCGRPQTGGDRYPPQTVLDIPSPKG